jgi:hypothetical protein
MAAEVKLCGITGVAARRGGGEATLARACPKDSHPESQEVDTSSAFICCFTSRQTYNGRQRVRLDLGAVDRERTVSVNRGVVD